MGRPAACAPNPAPMPKLQPSTSWSPRTSGSGSAKPSPSPASHEALARGEGSPFRRVLVAQRIDGPEQRTVRGLVHQVLTPTSRDQRDLASYDEWRAALVDDLLLPVDDVTPDEWASLWDRTVTAHRAWDEAGRP